MNAYKNTIMLVSNKHLAFERFGYSHKNPSLEGRATSIETPGRVQEALFALGWLYK